MATKMENRVGVNIAIFHSNPWCQFIELLVICCKDTNIHESVENKISDFWLHKAQNVRACHVSPNVTGQFHLALLNASSDVTGQFHLALLDSFTCHY